MSGSPRLHLRRSDDLRARSTRSPARCGGRVGLGACSTTSTAPARRAWAPGRAVEQAWTFDRADRLDLRWWPQGVEPCAAVDVAVVTWYAKKLPGDAGSQGSRLTFLDLRRCRYRHVLLVRPTLRDGVPGVAPLRVHAGGLVWPGDHLLTSPRPARGFWTARLADVVRVATDRPAPRCGRRRTATATCCRCTLRHRATRRRRASRRCATPSSRRDGRRPGRRGVRVGCGDPPARAVRARPGTAAGADAARCSATGSATCRAPCAARDRWYATTSHGRWRPGSVWSGTPGAMTRHRWATPMGPEDLAHDAATDLLWSVTEHPWARWVYSMRRSRFD